MHIDNIRLYSNIEKLSFFERKHKNYIILQNYELGNKKATLDDEHLHTITCTYHRYIHDTQSKWFGFHVSAIFLRPIFFRMVGENRNTNREECMYKHFTMFVRATKATISIYYPLLLFQKKFKYMYTYQFIDLISYFIT